MYTPTREAEASRPAVYTRARLCCAAPASRSEIPLELRSSGSVAGPRLG
jgi:hypothetical protein